MTEHQEQVVLMDICNLHERRYPGLELIHAIPNGGHRHIAVAAKLKAEGVKAGVPDLFLPVPKGGYHGLYVELKAKGGAVSDSQRTMLGALSRQGYACIVAYGWDEAWFEIERYMRDKNHATMEIFTESILRRENFTDDQSIEKQKKTRQNRIQGAKSDK